MRLLNLHYTQTCHKEHQNNFSVKKVWKYGPFSKLARVLVNILLLHFCLAISPIHDCMECNIISLYSTQFLQPSTPKITSRLQDPIHVRFWLILACRIKCYCWIDVDMKLWGARFSRNTNLGTFLSHPSNIMVLNSGSSFLEIANITETAFYNFSLFSSTSITIASPYSPLIQLFVSSQDHQSQLLLPSSLI